MTATNEARPLDAMLTDESGNETPVGAVNPFQDLFEDQRARCATGVTRSFNWRVKQHDRMGRMISENEKLFQKLPSATAPRGDRGLFSAYTEDDVQPLPVVRILRLR